MNFLAVNPWVHDFACYDLYAKPYGLLALSGSLRRRGHNLCYIDLMSPVEYGDEYATPRKPDGTGTIFREEIQKESAYRRIGRPYFRFGLPEHRFRAFLEGMDEPDLILVSSGMTYWYPGVRDTIAVIKKVFRKAECYLGGIYASLLPEHAVKHTGADHVVAGDGFSLIRSLTGDEEPVEARDYLPDFASFYSKPRYLPLLTSTGCPYECAYCSSRKLSPAVLLFPADECVKHVQEQLEKSGIDTIAFYDDALLFRREEHIYPILKGMSKMKKPVKCYTPNGLHVRFIDDECAELMKAAGFSKIRISLEFYDDRKSSALGPKVRVDEFKLAMNALLGAGFTTKQIGVYLLAGLYGQTPGSVRAAIDSVYDSGGLPYLSEYSPVPGAPLFDSDREHSEFDLSEPLWHNNSVFPMQSEHFTYMDFLELKNYNREKRRRYYMDMQ